MLEQTCFQNWRHEVVKGYTKFITKSTLDSRAFDSK
jgi:hypothetical protein